VVFDRATVMSYCTFQSPDVHKTGNYLSNNLCYLSLNMFVGRINKRDLMKGSVLARGSVWTQIPNNEIAQHLGGLHEVGQHESGGI